MTSDRPHLAIGSPVWTQRGIDRDGGAWRESRIVGETRVSWLVGESWRQFKIPKRDPRLAGDCVAFSLAEIEERQWFKANRGRVGEWVGRLADPAVLREVAKLIGYKEPQK